MRVRKTTGKGSAAWLLLAVATVSCTAWVQRAEQPESVVARFPALVVIGTSGGTELVLRRPSIARDSLVGRRIESLTDRGEGKRAAVPIEEVVWVATPEPDTISLYKVLAATAGAAFTVLSPFLFF